MDPYFYVNLTTSNCIEINLFLLPFMEKALFELNEKLKYSSDVESKLDSILNRYRSINEKQTERQQFIYQTEMDNIQNAYFKLKQSKELIIQIKALKINTSNVLQSNEYALNEYKSIKDIAVAHQNFAKTKYFIEMMKAPEVDYNDRDLFECHKDVYIEEEFACELKNYQTDLSVEETRIVTLKLNKIQKTSLNFTSTILQLIENYIENTNEFLGIEKIVEREEDRDILIEKVKAGVGSKDPVLKQIYLEYPMYLQCETKNLKDKVINVLTGSICNKFERLQGEKDFLTKLEFIFKDLCVLSKKSLSFYTFQTFLKQYHLCFKKFIDDKLENVLPEEILGIVEIKSLYYQTIEKDYGLVPESLGPKLIENEAVLLQKFSEIAREKLKDWIDNISVIEIEKFISRDTDIAKDEQGRLLSSGFINLLQIIKAQLEPIAYNRKIFIFLTGVIKERCISFQEKIKLSMQSEYKKAINGQGLSGFEDYCIIFGNSGLRLAQYISSLPFFQSDEVRELQSIFIEILQSSHEILANFIIQTAKPVLQHLLTYNWTKGNKGKVFFITVEDFLSDYSKAMAEHAFSRFISVLCNKIYLQYIKKLKNDKLEIDKATSQMITSDVNNLTKTFSKYISEHKFKDFLNPILKICPLVGSVSAELFIVELKSLMILDKTLEKSLIESIVAKKKNMTQKEKDNIYLKLPKLFKGHVTKKTTLLQRLLNK